MGNKVRADRFFKEPPKEDQRTPFQRDRDRIQYTTSFYRLNGVTQVVSPLEVHVFHNRLTHTLEVAQIARRLAEKLNRDQGRIIKKLGGIDPDVVEAAALAHDLGHPPFGHIAEKELDQLAKKYGEVDGFDGNAQSFRIVTRICAIRPAYSGLNLTRATLNAILKYPWLRGSKTKDSKKHEKFGAYRTEKEYFKFARFEYEGKDWQSPEAAIVDIADAIAYSVHDLEDFYRAGLIPIDRLKCDNDQFMNYLKHWAVQNNINLNEQSIATLKNLLDMLFTQERYIGTYQQRADLRVRTSHLIQQFIYAVQIKEPDSDGKAVFMDPIRELEMNFLCGLVWNFVIKNPQLSTQQFGQRRIIRTLFEIYLEDVMKKHEDLIPPQFREALSEIETNTKKDRKPTTEEIRLVADIVSSFTDDQAVFMYRRLTGIESGSVMDLLHR